ncbi:MAG: 5'-nucleotidase C-terminal domain-containing protein, partial [Paracoccaceae bacterium]|nr:5'-nucleotidase C-terminal domain-containing protein [Paracoccaceae bacterium]
AAGLRIAFDRKAEVGQWVTDMWALAGGRFDPLYLAKLYLVASNNCARNAGEGYKMFKAAKTVYVTGQNWPM